MLLIMAAAAKKIVAVDDSSSSDDEALKRCQEAVWDIRSDKNKGESFSVMSVMTDEVNLSVQTDILPQKYDISWEVHPIANTSNSETQRC